MIQSSLPDVSHKTAPLRAPALCGEEFNHYPSTLFIRQPGLQPAIDLELCLTSIVFERSHDSTPDL